MPAASNTNGVLRWADPPQVRRGRQKFDVSATVALLAAKPNKWAVVAEGGSAPTVRKHLKQVMETGEYTIEIQGSGTQDRKTQQLFARVTTEQAA